MGYKSVAVHRNDTYLVVCGCGKKYFQTLKMAQNHLETCSGIIYYNSTYGGKIKIKTYKELI